MGYSGLLFWMVCLAASFLAGARIGKNRLAASAVSVGCAAMLVLRAFFRHFPDVEFTLLPFGWYAAVHAWWAGPFAFHLFGAAIRQLRNRREKAALGLLALIFFFAVAYQGWATVKLDPSMLQGTPNADGVVHQSTKFSCGAAAAATLLTRIGYPTTEREMALRCGTNAVTGTDEIAVAFCLREKLVGTDKQVRMIRADWATLLGTPLPVLATIRHSLVLDHWVVVLKTSSERVIVADPTKGIVTLTRDRFMDQWLGVLVAVR